MFIYERNIGLQQQFVVVCYHLILPNDSGLVHRVAILEESETDGGVKRKIEIRDNNVESTVMTGLAEGLRRRGRPRICWL